MCKLGNSLRLPLEPGQPLSILRNRLVQHFDRHIPIQPFITSAVDLSHPTLADLLDDAVVAEGGANKVRHCQ